MRLGDYAEEFGELQIPVWVNVPRKVILEMGELAKAEKAAVFAWLSQVWGPEWPVDAIASLHAQCMEQDPALWYWLFEHTIRELVDHRNGVKKN